MFLWDGILLHVSKIIPIVKRTIESQKKNELVQIWHNLLNYYQIIQTDNFFTNNDKSAFSTQGIFMRNSQITNDIFRIKNSIYQFTVITNHLNLYLVISYSAIRIKIRKSVVYTISTRCKKNMIRK